MILSAQLPALLRAGPACVLDLLPLPHLCLRWNGERFRGHPVRGRHPLAPAQHEKLLAWLDPQRWRPTGGVRSSLPRYGVLFGQQLQLLYSPDCLWLWAWLGRQRLHRELTRADNRALAELLRTCIAAADRSAI